MDGELIKKALCFHGKPMQKIWDDERGVGDLQVAGVPDDGNYTIYMDRQKYFTFQDRAKRLKLHQFLARKACDLFDKDLTKIPAKPVKLELDGDDKNSTILAQLPPYETFLTKHQDKVRRCTLESIKTGDIVYAIVVRGKSGTSFHLGVKPLCTDEPNFKLLHDYKIKSIIPAQLCGPPLVDKLGVPRFIETNDYVRCEVIDFSIDAERMTLSLTPSDANKNIKLGKILPEELPPLYGKLVENSCMEIFEGYLSKAKEFDNPNYDILYGINGLNINDNFTLMSGLKHGFAMQEYAKELRQQQASKWAFRSVAEGIEYFKVGQHVEAFQCLNKALNIDPRNVEGLVARGALYANKGYFLKAVEDFEKALKLNSYHVNARKYMGETLVALGRSYEEDNRIQDAAKAYRDCLNIIPKHDQATMLLEAIQQRTGASVDVIPQAPTVKLFQHPDHVKASSPSNGSDSEDSSSDSGSDSEEENGTTKKKDSSLSPLSKKMALHAQQMESTGQQHFLQPFYMSSANIEETTTTQPQVIPNEFKLDEDDTELRVRKLLHDALKHKKSKKIKKRSKKSKKSKKTSKSTPKDSTRHAGHIEYNYVVNTESTLNANLKQYEKSIQELKKRQQKLSEQPSTSSSSSDHRSRLRQKSETPPPPPSINFGAPQSNADANKFRTVGFGRFASQTSAGHATNLAQKFSFQIKKPVKVDKLGLIRLATPALNKSPTPPPPRRRDKSRSRSHHRSRSLHRSRSRKQSRSRSRSKSRSRRRSRSVGRRRGWRSRSRSNSPDRYGGRRGRRSSSRRRSLSRSGSFPNRRRRDQRSRSRSERRRTPSPFVPRGTPSPRRHVRRSPSPRGGFRRGGRGRGRGISRGGPSVKVGNRVWKNPHNEVSPPVKFGNRVWKNPNNEVSPDKSKKPSSSDDRWVHDKFENPSDDPTIEEIDEIISKAQKERKQNIINNDKNILKKSVKW